jgi:hypothetical protein
VDVTEKYKRKKKTETNTPKDELEKIEIKEKEIPLENLIAEVNSV